MNTGALKYVTQVSHTKEFHIRNFMSFCETPRVCTDEEERDTIAVCVLAKATLC